MIYPTRTPSQRLLSDPGGLPHRSDKRAELHHQRAQLRPGGRRHRVQPGQGAAVVRVHHGQGREEGGRQLCHNDDWQGTNQTGTHHNPHTRIEQVPHGRGGSHPSALAHMLTRALTPRPCPAVAPRRPLAQDPPPVIQGQLLVAVAARVRRLYRNRDIISDHFRISRAFLTPSPPHTRRGPHSAWCPC